MQTNQIRRLSVREYGAPTPIKEASRSLEVSSENFVTLLLRASERIRHSVGIHDAVVFSGTSFQIIKIAGILKLSPLIELEIIPKFLSSRSASWKEDFYFITSLNRYGIHLNDDKISSGLNKSLTLIDALGQIMVDQYIKLRRIPIRTYQQRYWSDFNITGEIDDTEFYTFNEDGFLQSEFELNANNSFNEVFFEAFSILLVEVRNPLLKLKIKNCLSSLTPQNKTRSRTHHTVPSRFKKWEQLYLLSNALLHSYNLSYDGDAFQNLPGFIVRTAESWENLMLSSLKTYGKKYNIDRGNALFGHHSKPSVKSNPLFVNPDICLAENGVVKLILDAKYKTMAFSKDISVSRTDIYEMLAFLKSSKVKKGLLLYPAPDEVFDKYNFPGQTTAFEKITIDSYSIIALCINLSGISNKGGYQIFCQNLQTEILTYL